MTVKKNTILLCDFREKSRAGKSGFSVALICEQMLLMQWNLISNEVSTKMYHIYSFWWFHYNFYRHFHSPFSFSLLLWGVKHYFQSYWNTQKTRKPGMISLKNYGVWVWVKTKINYISWFLYTQLCKYEYMWNGRNKKQPKVKTKKKAYSVCRPKNESTFYYVHKRSRIRYTSISVR